MLAVWQFQRHVRLRRSSPSDISPICHLDRLMPGLVWIADRALGFAASTLGGARLFGHQALVRFGNGAKSLYLNHTGWRQNLASRRQPGCLAFGISIGISMSASRFLLLLRSIEKNIAVCSRSGPCPSRTCLSTESEREDERDAGDKVIDRVLRARDRQENRDARGSKRPARLCCDRGVPLIFGRLVPLDDCAGPHLHRRQRSIMPNVFYRRQMFLIEVVRRNL